MAFQISDLNVYERANLTHWDMFFNHYWAYVILEIFPKYIMIDSPVVFEAQELIGTVVSILRHYTCIVWVMGPDWLIQQTTLQSFNMTWNEHGPIVFKKSHVISIKVATTKMSS